MHGTFRLVAQCEAKGIWLRAFRLKKGVFEIFLRFWFFGKIFLKCFSCSSAKSEVSGFAHFDCKKSLIFIRVSRGWEAKINVCKIFYWKIKIFKIFKVFDFWKFSLKDAWYISTKKEVFEIFWDFDFSKKYFWTVLVTAARKSPIFIRVLRGWEAKNKSL